MKIKETLASFILAAAFTLGAEAKLIIHSPGYGLPNYKPGLLNKLNNWQSNDTLDKKGWQIINKKFPEPPEYSFTPKSHNVLCFKPVSDFNDFSTKDNHATFHIQTNKPIKSFTISGEYHIQKNGSIDILVSGDNKNWVKIESFDSRNKDNYIMAWSSSYYANINPWWKGQKISDYPHIKLKNNLYIRHSVSAKTNKNYLVEIWRFYASVITE